MFRTAIVAVAALAIVGDAAAQSTQTTRSTTTTTTTREGNTTTTRTRTRETSAGASIDAEALLGALVGAAVGAQDDGGWVGPRGEPARPEDAFGAWEVTDRRGHESRACRLELSENGLFGNRGLRARDCRELRDAGYWTMEQGEMTLRRHNGELLERLRFVDGAFVGRDYLLTRPGAPEPRWVEDWADRRARGGYDRDHRRDRDYGDRRGGGRLDMDEASGVWKSIETSNGQRRECRLTLNTNSAFGGYGASAFNCFGPLFGVISWRIEDGRVSLYKAGGGHVATLNGHGGRLTGRSASGEEIVLYR